VWLRCKARERAFGPRIYRYSGEPRAPVRDSDVPNVQRPLTLNMSAGVASTHGLAAMARDIATVGNRNTMLGSGMPYCRRVKVRLGFGLIKFSLGYDHSYS